MSREQKDKLWTEEDLRAMLGEKPKYLIKDASGGWYLMRRSFKCEDMVCTWTHNQQEARKLSNRVDAILLRNRIELEFGHPLEIVTIFQ